MPFLAYNAKVVKNPDQGKSFLIQNQVSPRVIAHHEFPNKLELAMKTDNVHMFFLSDLAIPLDGLLFWLLGLANLHLSPERY